MCLEYKLKLNVEMLSWEEGCLSMAALCAGPGVGAEQTQLSRLTVFRSLSSPEAGGSRKVGIEWEGAGGPAPSPAGTCPVCVCIQLHTAALGARAIRGSLSGATRQGNGEGGRQAVGLK